MNTSSSNIFDVGAKERSRTVTYTLGGCRATFTLLLQIEFHFTEKGFWVAALRAVSSKACDSDLFSMKCVIWQRPFLFVFPLFTLISFLNVWLFCLRLVSPKGKRDVS